MYQKPPKTPPATREWAETLALRAMAYIAANEDDLLRFLGESGLDLGTLREKINDTDTLAHILRFMLDHEPRLLAFCAEEGIAPTAPARALHILNPEENW